MKYFLALFVVVCPMFADELLEFRGASNASYRYADWSHSFANKVATDVYYIGVPGNNELSACGGYVLPAVKGLSVTPFLCGTVAKENGEAGIKAAVVIAWEKGHYKADAYYAHLWTTHGTISSYDLLDAGNVTRTVGKKWEMGISAGYFLQDRSWNPLVGPLIRRNDAIGFWGASFRVGPNNELRFIRTFTIKKR